MRAAPILSLPVCLSMVSLSPYWLRWASSATTMMFLRWDSGSSPSSNFCMVVKNIPLASMPSSSSLRCFLLLACTGTWRKKSAHLLNCPNSWLSRSVRSVMTTIVGEDNARCRHLAKNTIERDLPLPCVCQNTPPLPLVVVASFAEAMALRTA